jgi:hypothetical protein
MANVKGAYIELSQICNTICEGSFKEDLLPLISKNHAITEDYNTWLSVLKHRPEQAMFVSAIREYQLSILANSLGIYNLSFTGLRFFFERTLTAIFFSAKELELRLWMRGQRDTYWNELCDDEQGLFSHRFYNAFFPELKDEVKHYLVISKKVYRECSQYVHGNISAQDMIPEKLEFSEDRLIEWHNKADTIKEIVLFAFCLRYLPFLNAEQKARVEPIISENLGHIKAIRLLIQQQPN